MWIQSASKELRALAYSQDGRTLFTVEENRVRSWDIKSQKATPLFEIDNPQCVATKADVTADGRYLVLTTRAECVVWDVNKGERQPDFPRGWSWLVPASTGSEIRFMGKNQLALRVYDPEKKKERKYIDVTKGLGKMYCWALSPDEKQLLLVDSKQAIILQNVATGAASTVAPRDLTRGMIDNMYFSPDGKSAVLLLRQGVEIWNAVDMSVRVPRFPVPDAPWSFAFHPKASYFAAANAAKNLTLYNLDTGAPVQEFEFQLGQWTRQIAFAPDGSSCAACGTSNRFAVIDSIFDAIFRRESSKFNMEPLPIGCGNG
jgi:WD40 repeat protein